MARGPESAKALAFHTLTIPSNVGALRTITTCSSQRLGAVEGVIQADLTGPGMPSVEICEAAAQLHWELFLLEAVTLGC